MKLNSSIVFFLVLATLLVGLMWSSGVIDRAYGRYGYEGFVDSTANVGTLYIVKANWCPHCVAAMPEFEKLIKANTVKCSQGPLTVQMLEDTNPDDKVKIKSLGVQGYPSILANIGATMRNYDGARTAQGIQDWAATL